MTFERSNMKYYRGLAFSSFGVLRDIHACSVCGKKHHRNMITEDGKQVCEYCFNKDDDKTFIGE